MFSLNQVSEGQFEVLDCNGVVAGRVGKMISGDRWFASGSRRSFPSKAAAYKWLTGLELRVLDVVDPNLAVAA